MQIIHKKLLTFFFVINISHLFCVSLDETYTLHNLTKTANINSFLVKSDQSLVINEEDITNALNFCSAISILEDIVAITSYILPILLPFFGNALGGDMLTGNAFVEGSNEKTLVAIKLSKSMQTLHHISLEELQEIFMHLREDLTKRTHYLEHRQDKDKILKKLHEREKRLLHNLHSLEQCVFHFREHRTLIQIQRKLLVAGIVLTPFIIATLLCASFDAKNKFWHLPTEQQLMANLDFFFEQATP